MATDIHTFISAFFCLATELLTQLHRKLNSHVPHIPKHREVQDEEVNLTLPRGPHQVNSCQTLSPSFISSDSYWCQQSTEEPDLRACFDTVQQWIINSSKSCKASARSEHEPSAMINQNAIINAPASHKMSPNSPWHKIQKAPHRNAHPHAWKQKQFCAFTIFSTTIVPAVSGLRAIIHGLAALTEESYMQNQVHIFNFHSNSIHLGLDKTVTETRLQIQNHPWPCHIT